MQHIENPMIVTDINMFGRFEFELHEVYQCSTCNCDIEDEDEAFDDGDGTYCSDCLLDKYRLTRDCVVSD